jgi:hypothetical protein
LTEAGSVSGEAGPVSGEAGSVSGEAGSVFVEGSSVFEEAFPFPGEAIQTNCLISYNFWVHNSDVETKSYEICVHRHKELRLFVYITKSAVLKLYSFQLDYTSIELKTITPYIFFLATLDLTKLAVGKMHTQINLCAQSIAD